MTNKPEASNEPEEQRPITSLARRLAAALVVHQRDGSTYQSMATLISPQLALVPVRVVEESGLLDNPAGWISIWSGYESPQRITARVEVQDPAADFAVLRLNVPITDGPSGLRVALKLATDSKWESYVATTGKPNEGIPLEGRLGGSSPEYLKLRVDGPKSFEWAGVGGAPVVVENELAGIISLADESATTLYAIRISQIIESKQTKLVRELVAVDPRSFGGSSTPGWVDQATIDRFSEDVRAVLARGFARNF